MELNFSKSTGARSTPVINNGKFAATPNVNMVDGIDFAAAQSAQDAATDAGKSADSAAQSATSAANSAASAASSASTASAAANTAVTYADGWEDAYAEAQEAVDEAKSAVRAADVVYFGFTNLTADAESVAADQPADAVWSAADNNMHFKIPKGVDGTMEGLTETPIIDDPSKQDWILIVDETDNSVKREVINDFLNMTTKSVNGITPDANGNINLTTGDTNPVLYLGETVTGSFGTNPIGAVAADGSQINVSSGNYQEIVDKIVSGELASVTEQAWQAGQNDVFSQGNWNGSDDGTSMTWFRVPNLKDNGTVVTTNGDFTLNGNITLAGIATVNATKGNQIHDGDFRMEDTSRNVYTDIALLNRSVAVDQASADLAAVAFIDRRDNNKYIGGMYTTEAGNNVGVQANFGDLNLTSASDSVTIKAGGGQLNLDAGGGTVNVNAGITTQHSSTIGGNLDVVGILSAKGPSHKIEATADDITISADVGDTGISGGSVYLTATDDTGGIKISGDANVSGNLTVQNSVFANQIYTTQSGTPLEIGQHSGTAGDFYIDIHTDGKTEQDDGAQDYAYRWAYSNVSDRVGTVGLQGGTNAALHAVTFTTSNTTQQGSGARGQGLITNLGMEVTSTARGSVSDTAAPSERTSVFECTGWASVSPDSGQHYNLLGGYDTGYGWSGIEKVVSSIGGAYGVGFTVATGSAGNVANYMAGLYNDGKFKVNGTPLTTVDEVNEHVEAVHAEYRPIIEELRAEIAALKEKING